MEIGVGNGYALKFVKMAHIASDDIESNQNCPIHSKLNIDEFCDAIEHT